MIFYISGNEIFRIDYSGENEIFVRTLEKNHQISAFQADIFKDRLYWVQQKQIHTCLQDGTNYFILTDLSDEALPNTSPTLGNLSQINSGTTDIKVTHRHVYWYTSLTNTIYILDKFSGSITGKIPIVYPLHDTSPVFVIVQEWESSAIKVPENQDSK